jgi:Tfp pilus assembly protein PilF
LIPKAVDEFQIVLGVDKNNVRGHILLSYSLQRLPNPQMARAASILEAAALVDPEDGEIHLNLAQVYQKTNRENEAITEFQQTLDLSEDPGQQLAAHLGLMSIYRKRGNDVKANVEYEAAKKLYPDIGKVIEREEINMNTPSADIGHLIVNEGTGSHPSLEKRIEKLQETLKTLKK